jgi:PAS domain S-box-containing protein
MKGASQPEPCASVIEAGKLQEHLAILDSRGCLMACHPTLQNLTVGKNYSALLQNQIAEFEHAECVLASLQWVLERKRTFRHTRLRKAGGGSGAEWDFSVTRVGGRQELIVASLTPCSTTRQPPQSAIEETKHALRESEERNRAILNAIPDLMFLLSLDGVYEDYHAKDHRELLMPPEKFLGKHIRDVLPRDLAERFLALFHQVPESGEPLLEDYDLLVDGKCRHYEARMIRTGEHILCIVRDITDRKMVERELKQSHIENEFLAGRILHDQDDERKRIARELHDSLSQKLAALSVLVSDVRQEAVTSPALASKFDSIQRELSLAVAEVRGFSHELHPGVLDHAGVLEAISSHAREFGERSGIEVSLQLPKTLNISPDFTLCLYRVIQEALHNCEKHSKASHVTVVMRCSPASVQLSIEDDGVGFDLASARAARGLGLVSIEERVRLFHGTVEVHSFANRGTCILIELPISML